MAIGTDIVVVDIETVPDTELARHEDLYDDQGEERFAAPPLHRIVAIAFVHAQVTSEQGGRSVDLVDCRAGLDESASEEDLLRGFWSLVGRLQPTLVTWNGRAFDVPVLLWRSMRWRVAAPAWFRRLSNFENYSYRFAFDWHADLMDIMTGHGAARRISLDAAARAVGAPGKLGTGGGDVGAMIAAGRLADVRAYCELDALNTYLVWLGWRHLMGELGDDELDHAHAGLAAWLGKEQAPRPHCGEFLRAWQGPRSTPPSDDAAPA
jgi:predicted PolB exonuclease-like 3'-5' exonuclease